MSLLCLLAHPLSGTCVWADSGPAPSTYYREPGSYGTKRETVPPQYVRNLSQTGIERFKDIHWLDVGLDFRTRYEYRDGDVRRPVQITDNNFLLRTRVYAGIKEIIDPLRMVIEVEDARAYNSKFPKDNRDWNEFEPIQMYGELFFRDLLGKDDRGNTRPLSLRGGRMWLEKLDRRLIGNNAWRNTTNTFQGVHVDLGKDANDWELELMAMQPLNRLLFELDDINKGQWFYAAIGHWRRWSDIVTIEPYYLMIDQDAQEGRPERQINALAVRFYGPMGNTGFNYDNNFVFQFGKDSGRTHDAFGSASEIGYTFQHAWKPRTSLFYGYASGDRDPTDLRNERFDRFYGFARPWSANDYMIWENFHAPKIRFEAVPLRDLRFDAGYSWYWLASDRDRWANANLRDPTGKSGDFIGHELDFRARYPFGPHVDATVGYAHFEPGNFPENRGKDTPTDFLYLEVSLNAFPRI